MNDLERELQRLEYWQGQLLRSDDFATQQNSDDQRRWWHNRALHHAYGVSLGLGVTQDGDKVSVSCGLAYDCEGRELLVPNPTRLSFPKWKPTDKNENPPEPRLLILRRVKEGGREPEMIACDSCSTSARTADFGWVRFSRFDGRTGVPLAWMNRDSGGAPQLDMTFEQPRSRPLARPHTGSGMTPPRGTVWELWNEVVPGALTPPETIGLQTRVNTAAAGFAEIPVYIAQLRMGDRPVLIHPLPPPICRIDQAAPDSFLFRVWLPRMRTQDDPVLVVARSQVNDIADGRIHLDSAVGFRKGDPICIVGGAGSSVITAIYDDDNDPSIEIYPALEELAIGDTLRLESLVSLDRIAALLDGLEFFPGMEVQIEGTNADTGEAVSRRLRVVVTANGVVRFVPSDIPKLAIGDGATDVPRVSIVSTQAVDFPLVVEDLGWHVCWFGAVCEGRPSFPCTDQVCEGSAEEVC